MTRLNFNSPLLKKKSRKVPHHKHRILIYMLYRELLGGWTSVKTSEISQIPTLNMNRANQILRRMKDYGYIKGHRQLTTEFKLVDENNPDNTICVTVKGRKLPKPYLKSDIEEKKRKNIVQWSLTKQGREFAKRIWFESGKYQVSNNIFFYEFELRNKESTEPNVSEIIVNFFYEKIVFNKRMQKEKEITSSNKINNNINIEMMKEVRDALKPIALMKNVKNYFKDNGYSIISSDANKYCDLEIMKEQNKYEVKVFVNKPDWYNVSVSVSELHRTRQLIKIIKLCFVEVIKPGEIKIMEVDIS